jgi:hypothetical protein
MLCTILTRSEVMHHLMHTKVMHMTQTKQRTGQKILSNAQLLFQIADELHLHDPEISVIRRLRRLCTLHAWICQTKKQQMSLEITCPKELKRCSRHVSRP